MYVCEGEREKRRLLLVKGHLDSDFGKYFLKMLSIIS